MELRGTGVKIQALCPGFTYTGFHDQPEYAAFDRTVIPKALWSSADKVAAESLSALGRRQVICIPGFNNRLLVALSRSSLTAPLLRAAASSVTRSIRVNK